MDVINLFIDPFRQILPKLPEVLINLVVGILVIKVVVFILRKSLKVMKFPSLRGMIISGVKFFLWVLLVAFIANSLGFGRFAIAISGSAAVLVFFLNTGASGLLTDIISGLFLCGDCDFQVGMRIAVGAGDARVEGKIKDIDMRKVRVIDDEGQVHVFPNAFIEKNEWVVIEKNRNTVIAEKAAQAKEIIKKKIRKDDKKGSN